MQQQVQSAMEAASSALATPTMVTGGGVSIVGLITQSWFIGFLGLCIALAGFLMNWHFLHKRDKREQAEHEARMREMGK